MMTPCPDIQLFYPAIATTYLYYYWKRVIDIEKNEPWSQNEQDIIIVDLREPVTFTSQPSLAGRCNIEATSHNDMKS